MAAAVPELAIAANRFGLGARAGDLVPADPRVWLRDQLDRYDPSPAAFDGAPSSLDILIDYASDRRAMKGLEGAGKEEAQKRDQQETNRTYRDEIDRRVQAALHTETPFVERLVHFWANHFAISAGKQPVKELAGAFEREAIRPHVLGRFEDMLVAVEQHPAMQIYLDQASSIGPDSGEGRRAAERDRQRGINENLAREIMELHTLGVRGGYDQRDVTAFAMALTGWTVAQPRPDKPVPTKSFLFRPWAHQPGAQTIMDTTYDQKGAAQGVAILRDLARHEATARHIATKLARHFIADEAPSAVVERLAAAFSQSGGDLRSVSLALIEAPEAWEPKPRKFKSPWEWSVSALRALDLPDFGRMEIARVMNELGQPVWRPGSPAGWDDVAANWSGPDALLRRVQIANLLASRMPDDTDPRTLAPTILPDAVSDLTLREIGRAESVQTAVALLLVSPDFQRR